VAKLSFATFSSLQLPLFSQERIMLPMVVAALGLHVVDATSLCRELWDHILVEYSPDMGTAYSLAIALPTHSATSVFKYGKFALQMRWWRATADELLQLAVWDFPEFVDTCLRLDSGDVSPHQHADSLTNKTDRLSVVPLLQARMPRVKFNDTLIFVTAWLLHVSAHSPSLAFRDTRRLNASPFGVWDWQTLCSLHARASWT